MTKHRIIVMGVSGCGKTTIGDLVARELGVPFLDGDSLHPAENVAKMATGTPLTDEDRWPWLATVGTELANAGDGGMVLACSAATAKPSVNRHRTPSSCTCTCTCTAPKTSWRPGWKAAPSTS
jgi:carbohydrate kinase (thermoresistant glucokinase family)